MLKPNPNAHKDLFLTRGRRMPQDMRLAAQAECRRRVAARNAELAADETLPQWTKKPMKACADAGPHVVCITCAQACGWKGK